MKKIILFSGLMLALFFLQAPSIFAQSYIQFVENKGQWDGSIKYKGDLSNGMFALESNGYRVLLHNQKDMQELSKLYGHGPVSEEVKKDIVKQNVSSLTVHSHSYQVKFLGANKNAIIIPEKPIETYNNYFIGNDQSKWANNCKVFTAVTYKDIYPNIDVRYYTGNNNLKYDIIINPGGDVNKIALYFDGVDGIKNNNGQLNIKTSIGDIKELEPYSYQLGKNGKKEVPCSYDVKGNIVRFKLNGTISTTETLVIDPTLIFSTFSGSTADNWGYTATYDNAGNFYAGGIVFALGFKVTNGAFQTVYQGGNTIDGVGAYDIGIMKFNTNGTSVIYATYIGGSIGNEQPHSMIVDKAGNLVIAGRTSSGSSYPTTAPTFGSGGGTWDIFLTKLNSDGTALIGSRRIGGSGEDGVNYKPKYPDSDGSVSLRRNYGDDARSEVIVDENDNIYLASCTQSANFLTTTGAAQTIKGGNLGSAPGGYQDGVVIKTNPDLSNIIFSTLLGGDGDDAAFVLSINPLTNNIYVAGGTTSTSLPGDRSGVIYPSFMGGECDGFLTILSNDGSQFIKTTYLGTTGSDLVYGVQFDKNGYPYIMGTVWGSVSWPVTPNASFVQPNGKQFIAKLKRDISGFEYSTIFGSGTSSSPNISPTAFLVDRCENVYVSGWGGQVNTERGYPNAGTLGLTVSNNAYKSTTDGSDLYFIVISKNAQSLLYATFFGQVGGAYGEHVDGGTSRFDQNGVIYQSICANCVGGATFPTSPAAVYPTNGTASNGPNNIRCNLAAVKISFNYSGVGSGIRSSISGVPRDVTGCVPLTVDFTDTLNMAVKYVWNFGDGSPDVTTSINKISHQYNSVGSYDVRLISIDSSTCNISDTSTTTIRVRNDDALLNLLAKKLPPCDSLKFEFQNISTPATIKPFGPKSFRWEFGDGTFLDSTGTQTITHTYPAAGQYNLKLILLDTSYCNAPDDTTILLRIAPLVKAMFETPATGCAPYNAIIKNTSLAGTSFTWDFGDGSPISTETNPTHLYADTGTYIIKLHAVDPGTCNGFADTSFTIKVFGSPVASFSYAPTVASPNVAIVFNNFSTGATSYKWDFGDGETINTSKKDTTISHLYNKTGTYNVCLTAINDAGCDSILCRPVETVIIPLVDVPSGFTPNGDGQNDFVSVKGFGIAKMMWKIFNRWGKQVYVGTSIKGGWDGKFNGVLQPQDVYTYTLQVEFVDGQKYTKTGDITLLR